MNVIEVYYGVFLNFAKLMGLGYTNEDSRASVFFSLTLSTNIGTILNLLEIEYDSLGSFWIVAVLMLFYFGSYFYFKRPNTKSLILEKIDQIGTPKKFLYYIFSFIYFFSSIIIFLKTY